MKVLLGIDIGTQGVKTAAFASDGRCLAQAFAPSRVHRRPTGAVEEDPEVQVAGVLRTIRICLRTGGIAAQDVVGLGIDGQMAGVIGIDRAGTCVTPYDSWLDARCAPQAERMARLAGCRVLQRTGGPASVNHGSKILWWKHERPATYRRIHAFVQPGGYAAMRLCGLSGEQAFIDWTYLHFSGFADTAAGRWDAGLCSMFGVDASRLPRIVAPQSVVGHLTTACAARCGLKPGVPVVAGCGDTAASFLACGAVAPGVCVDVAGTAAVFAATGSAMQADLAHSTLSCCRSAVPGLWHAYAYIRGGGLNLDWFRREFAGDPAWEAMERLAAGAAGGGPMFIPHMSGRVTPSRPGLRGAWVGLSQEHTRGDLLHAVLEGTALEYAIYRDILPTLHASYRMRELRVTGGGERSPTWNQLKADVLGTPVRRIRAGHGAPLGAAMLAGWGVGVLSGLPAAARSWVRSEPRPSRPRAAQLGRYACRLAAYRDLLERLDIPPIDRQGATL